MVANSPRPLSGASPHLRSAGAGGAFRVFGRRRMTKLRFRALVIFYLAMGCIIPFYVMRHAEDELLYQEGLKVQVETPSAYSSSSSQEQQHQRLQHHKQQELAGTGGFEYIKFPRKEHGGGPAAGFDNSNPKQYKRRAFFQDLDELDSLQPAPQNTAIQQQPRHDRVLHPPHTQDLPGHPYQEEARGPSSPQSPSPQQFVLQAQQLRRKELLSNLTVAFALQRKLAKLYSVTSPEDYKSLVQKVVQEAHNWVLRKMPRDFLLFETRIPGTNLDTTERTRRFRQLMDEALNKGHWVYEPHRDYPDFGGVTGWNKKKKHERDRDVAIDRPPFPEAGKYHWEPIAAAPTTGAPTDVTLLSGKTTTVGAKGWHAQRIQREDFCRILGPRHIVLVGDLIHWQLHDSIMYNMFDTPQACYGDLACHLGVGHPLCPLPDDVRLKFVRNDLLSPTRPRKSRLNETKTQDPVEMPWLRDMKLKDTVILGATHQTMHDKVFRKRLTDTVTKIRKARPEALIIYRNNPVGHPDCPSKSNGFNSDKETRLHQQQQLQLQLQQQASNLSDHQISFQATSNQKMESQRPLRRGVLLAHNSSTFSAPAAPFEQDIPLAEMLDYPLNWVHYDRQNQVAKEIVEASGGIYWNVATMTNMRPDGHAGGQDCLSYKRPGPTDEWAVSLYNLFKTIDIVEQEFAGSRSPRSYPSA